MLTCRPATTGNHWAAPTGLGHHVLVTPVPLAICTIPARPDLSWRLDAAYVARLVPEHRLVEAHEVMHRLVDAYPRTESRL